MVLIVLCLPRRCYLRLLLFCTCPPLCAGALWSMPAWAWRDDRSVYYVIFLCPQAQAVMGAWGRMQDTIVNVNVNNLLAISMYDFDNSR